LKDNEKENKKTADKLLEYFEPKVLDKKKRDKR